ncbi:hypothetical protein BGZ90_004644, partial [Linnemannia elongata]
LPSVCSQRTKSNDNNIKKKYLSLPLRDFFQTRTTLQPNTSSKQATSPAPAPFPVAHTMSKETDAISLGSPPHDAQSIAPFRYTASQSSTNSTIASIGRVANKAAQPSSTANDRSISHAFAAIKRLSSASIKTTLHRLSTVITQYSGDIKYEISTSVDTGHAVSTTEVKSPASNAQALVLPTKPRMADFSKNVNPPVFFISLPEFGSPIDTTPQFALCFDLLRKSSDPIDQQGNPSQVLSSCTTAQLAWIQSMNQDPVEQKRLHWLGACMVDEFTKDGSKDSIEIAEM